MRTAQQDSTLITIYDSIEESLGQAVEFVGGADTGQWRQLAMPFPMSHQTSFIGRQFEKWQQVIDATREAWERGHRELTRMIERLAQLDVPEPMDRKRRTRYEEMDGDEIDLDRLRAGQPYWRTSRRENTQGPQTVTILVDVVTPANKDSMDVLWRGAAGLALALQLEEHGYRTEIWTVHKSAAYERRSGSQMCAVCLKRPEDPLDLSGLINAISGWYYRTVGFANMEANCVRDRRQNGFVESFGNCQIPYAAELDHVSPDEDRIFVSGAYSFDGAARIVEAELKKFVESRQETRK